jgi:hypothetical protein
MMNLNADLTSPDGEYTLTRDDARTAMQLVLGGYTAPDYLGKDHAEQVTMCGAALAAAQGMDMYSGYLIYMSDPESFPYDVAHALAHLMENMFRQGVELS